MISRPLTPGDADSIAALWLAGANEGAEIEPHLNPTVTQAEYSESVKIELESQLVIGWGAFTEDSNKLLGYLIAKVTDAGPEFDHGRFLFLLDLDVEVNARRKGVASHLVAVARAFARDESLASIEVCWLSSDPRASSFWKSQGFAQYLARARTTSSAAQ